MKKELTENNNPALSHRLAEVLSHLMKDARLTDAELGTQVKIPSSTITKLRLGHSLNPTIESLIPIARYFGIDTEQLLGFRKIDELVNNASLGVITHAIPVLEIDEIRPYLAGNLHGRARERQYIHTSTQFTGKGFALIVKGSMMSSAFPEGAILIFDEKASAKDRHYVVVLLDGKDHPTIRQIFFDGDEAFFKPFNPELGGILQTNNYIILGVMKQQQINY